MVCLLLAGILLIVVVLLKLAAQWCRNSSWVTRNIYAKSMQSSVANYKQIKPILFFFFIFRERPAAIPIHVKSIDDTSNFDDFPESEFESSKF